MISPRSKLLACPVLAFALALSVAAPASAYTEFQREFLNVYTKGKEADKDFRKQARKAKCYVCHQGKEDRKNCNRYGLVLAERLGEDDKKDKAKIVAAIKEVADLPSGADADSATFGALIAEGKLPGGTLDDCKIEPPADDTAQATAEGAE